MRFEWNAEKAAANVNKHRVSLDDAATVFNDPLAQIFDDEDHSISEHREIIIGHSIANRLLVVSFIERTQGVVRIISARFATRVESKDYEENRRF